MRKNRLLPILSSFLIFALLLSTFYAMPAKADSVDFVSYMTQETMTFTSGGQTVTIDSDGSANPSTYTIPRDASVSLLFSFAIPDGTQLDTSKGYTVGLPSQFKDYTGSGSLDGFGTYSVSGGIVTLNFFSTVNGTNFNDYTSRGGNFTITGTVDSNAINTKGTTDISFFASGAAKLIPITFADAASPVITKASGSYDAATDKITWQITVSNSRAGSKDISSVSVKDTPDANQTYDTGSAAATLDGSASTVNESISGSDVIFTLPDIPVGSTAIITYTTAPVANLISFPATSASVGNSAELNYTSGGVPGEPVEATASANVTTGSWITKQGTQSGNVIKWNINVDPENKTIPGSFTVTDTLPSKYLSVDASTIELNGVTLDADPSHDPYYSISTDSGGIQTITFYFTGDAVSSKDITFSTDIDPTYYNSNNGTFKNKAVLEDSKGDTAYATGSVDTGVTSTILSKTGSYDASTHLVTWTVTVDSNKVAITNPVVTDNIPYNSGMQKFNDSYGITEDNSPVTCSSGSDSPSAPYYTKTESGSNDVITVHLNDFNDGDSPVIIKYQTSVNDSAYYAENGTKYVSNSAELTGSNTSGNIDQKVTPSVPVNSTMIEKTAQGYNYDTRALSWKITVDKNEMTLTGAQVTDNIPKGQELTDGTVNLNGSALDTDSSKTQYYTISGDSSSGQTLTVYLGNIDRDAAQPQITLNTTITDLEPLESSNSNVNFKNSASIMTDGTTATATAQNAVTNYLVNKGNGPIDNTYLYVDWWVRINSNQLPMNTIFGSNSISLTDTLPQGLELDTTSVKLYKMTRPNATSPTLTISDKTVDAIPVSASDISYNSATRQFIFTLPSGIDPNQAYELDYRTYVVDQSKAPFNNSVTMTGIAATNTNNSDNAQFSYVTSGGHGWGTLLGSVTVTKEDQGNNPIKNSDAVFDLIDWTGSVVQEATATDLNGQVVFQRLNKDSTDYPYTVVEKYAPDGYSVDSSAPQEVVFQGSGASANPLVFKDTALTAFITLHKTDSSGNPLAGGIFGIYDLADTAYANPLKTAQSDSSGNISFPGMGVGSYNVKEITPPSDYTASADVIPVSVTASLHSNPLNVNFTGGSSTFADTIKTASVTFVKKGGSSLLPDANFALYYGNGSTAVLDASGNAVTATSGSDGIVTFSNINYGDYTIKETQAPAGYYAIAPIKIHLHDPTPFADGISSNFSGGTLNLGTVYDTMVQLTGTIRVFKTDEKGNPLSGASFTLYNSSGAAYLSAISGADGVAEFDTIPFGNYTIRESAAPDGYQISGETLNVFLNTASIQNFYVSDKQLTNPTNPTNPTKPTNPTNPTNPSNPSNPIKPSNPTKPLNPSNPSNTSGSLNSKGSKTPSTAFPNTLDRSNDGNYVANPETGSKALPPIWAFLLLVLSGISLTLVIKKKRKS